MQLPKRKSNRLKHYDYSQNGAYFITVCVKDGRELLGKVVGGDDHSTPYVLLSEYGMVTDKYIRRITGINQYVIMPNHIHMIILIDSHENGTMWASSPTQPVPQLIKSLKTLISKEIGCSIFQRSYYDHVIRSEKDYEQICQYIDTNPLRWTEDEYYTK
ncbi:MAG: transposase [Syntrophomonadaceae bacterium]|nr:transposase [Syntrophomonadaceae bacterium]